MVGHPQREARFVISAVRHRGYGCADAQLGPGRDAP
jgi:hypothetical protein